ncbi:MAG: hypothetical protein JWO56_2654, partial [Acidobacteria bacterium]|nr:hypothetical protein [Acidobacteriota bacterium]
DVWTRLDGAEYEVGDIYVDASCGNVFEALEAVVGGSFRSFRWRFMFVTENTRPRDAGALLIEVDEFKRKQAA